MIIVCFDPHNAGREVQLHLVDKEISYTQFAEFPDRAWMRTEVARAEDGCSFPIVGGLSSSRAAYSHAILFLEPCSGL
jgi:hypothetical protein